MLARLAVFAAAPITWVGCGGAQSPTTAVRSVVQSYYADLERGDGAAACSLLSAQARQHLVRPLLLFPALRDLNVNCPRLMTLYARTLREKNELTGFTIGAVTVTGKHATVAVAEPRGAHQVALVKTAKGWRISTPTRSLGAPRRPIGG